MRSGTVGTAGLGVPGVLDTFTEITAPRQGQEGVVMRGGIRKAPSVGVWGLSWTSLEVMGALGQPEI